MYENLPETRKGKETRCDFVFSSWYLVMQAYTSNSKAFKKKKKKKKEEERNNKNNRDSNIWVSMDAFSLPFVMTEPKLPIAAISWIKIHHNKPWFCSNSKRMPPDMPCNT